MRERKERTLDNVLMYASKPTGDMVFSHGPDKTQRSALAAGYVELRERLVDDTSPGKLVGPHADMFGAGPITVRSLHLTTRGYAAWQGLPDTGKSPNSTYEPVR